MQFYLGNECCSRYKRTLPCKVKGEVDKKHLIDKFTHLGEKLLWLTHINTEDKEHHHQ